MPAFWESTDRAADRPPVASSLGVARLDRGADVGEAVVLVADRIEAPIRPVDARGLIERIVLAGLQRHGGDVAVVLLDDARDGRVEIDEVVVDPLVVAMADGAVDALRRGVDLRPQV